MGINSNYRVAPCPHNQNGEEILQVWDGVERTWMCLHKDTRAEELHDMQLYRQHEKTHAVFNTIIKRRK